MTEYIWAFLVGGAICAVGQVLIDRTKLTPARILVIFVVSGVLLTGVGLWDKVVDFAGAGATVPIVGFGYSLAKGAMDAAKEQGVIGAFTGGISATAGGITAAIVFGYLFAVIFKPKTKK